MGGDISLSIEDETMLGLAIEMAHEADREGNLPIGAVICRKGEVVGAGKNGIWWPEHRPDRHAEMQAIRSVASHLWAFAGEMTVYTTLEPCLMCFGAIMLHRVGRVVYGAADPNAGAEVLLDYLPPYFRSRVSEAAWVGPAFPELCDPLFERALLRLAEVDRTRKAGGRI